MSQTIWAVAHHAVARDMFRRQLAEAIGLHAGLVGEAGHLTRADMVADLLAAVVIVSTGQAEAALAAERPKCP